MANWRPGPTEWRYGDVLRITSSKSFRHARLMYVGPGQNPYVFRAVALKHPNKDRVNSDPTVRWDYTRWELVDD